MRRLPLRLLRSAAASSSSLRGPAISLGGWIAPSLPHPAADAAPTAAPAGLALWWPRRGYSQFASGFTPLQPKPLGSILDLERAKGLSPKHLVATWDDYHLGRGHTGASMKAKLYHLLEQRSAGTSLFLCGGEVDTPLCLCKDLKTIKLEALKQALTLQLLITEFAETKDTVLIRGDVFTSKLTDAEAKGLLETAHSFYLNNVRYRLVERFNKETHEFEFKDVLQVLDMPTM